MDYLLLLSSIVLGALSVFLFHLHEPRRVKLLNAFTGAYLLCLTILHLLPELYHSEGLTGHPEMKLGILILAGFFVQVALDAISMGVEHGHSHPLHGRMPIGIIAEASKRLDLEGELWRAVLACTGQPARFT